MCSPWNVESKALRWCTIPANVTISDLQLCVLCRVANQSVIDQSHRQLLNAHSVAMKVHIHTFSLSDLSPSLTHIPPGYAYDHGTVVIRYTT